MDYGEVTSVLRKKRNLIRQKLVNVAKREVTITYTELFGEYGLDMNHQGHRDAASALLGVIGAHEHKSKRPMLTAVVVYKKTHQEKSLQPGEGFFTLARELECFRGGSEFKKMAFHVGELKKVYSYYSENQT